VRVKCDFLPYFALDGEACRSTADYLVAGTRRVPVRDGIPRFTPDRSYATGNFSMLRERHAVLQLDSRNGTSDRRDTLLERTNWTTEAFRGAVVLECGCGAGADTEVLLSLRARVVAVDLAGVDMARRNVGDHSDVQFVQASIEDLPLQRGAFDIVFCHRVLQHTPDPEAVLRHILSFVKPDGLVFVHSYARTFVQCMRWKYALRPVTRRMNPERLYRMIERGAPILYRLTDRLQRSRPGWMLAHVAVPFLNYRRVPQFANLSDEQVLEYGIHDTFDALSPRYDRPIRPDAMRSIAAAMLRRPHEVVEKSMITLLRTLQAPPPPAGTRG
jgi:SAM-dependent methyltransferase